MQKLNANPSKAEEMAHLRRFIAELPADSYLADYLRGLDDVLDAQMRDDMCYNVVDALREEYTLRTALSLAQHNEAAMREQRDLALAQKAEADKQRAQLENDDYKLRCDIGRLIQ